MPRVISAEFATHCQLCKEPLDDDWTKLGKYFLHKSCYPIAVSRIAKLADIIFASDAEFFEWMVDNDRQDDAE